jgi:hypothetical protein
MVSFFFTMRSPWCFARFGKQFIALAISHYSRHCYRYQRRIETKIPQITGIKDGLKRKFPRTWSQALAMRGAKQWSLAIEFRRPGRR